MENTADPPKRIKGPKALWATPDGDLMDLNAKTSGYDKFQRDVLTYWHGELFIEDVDIGNKRVPEARVTVFDPSNPAGTKVLPPGPTSPICAKCALFKTGCKNPFMQPVGSETPLITVICDSVTKKEDEKGQLGTAGFPGWIAKIIHSCRDETGVSLDDIRWFPLTRCANLGATKVDYKIKGNWCRYHLIDDLKRHPPQLIIPVGTASLGMLCHKSNAQDWQGKLLTYRGWPDDWLTDKRYVLPRPHPVDPAKQITGHPIFGEVPKVRIPMMPIQNPHIVLSTMNSVVIERWKRTLISALKLVKEGVKPKLYTRPWYRFTKDPEVAAAGLREIIANPGMLVCYDTETTGLKPWSFHKLCKMSLATQPAIVSMMFRWRDPKTGNSRSIGFPWDYGPTEKQPDYALSPMRPHMKMLAPLVYEALTKSQLIGHNLTFDVLYTFATMHRQWLVGWDDPEFNKKRDSWLCALADAAKFDTWHAAYTYMQRTGSLGLEVIAYEWAPELAGYEEDMTLLIDLHRETLHPGENKGGHYLNCAESYWPTHVVPYVMGDVESCFLASERLRDKLKATESRRYEIPLARPGSPGRFRYFKTPSRAFVYDKIMAPAAGVLMKIMGRGMYVNRGELTRLETTLPNTINELRAKLKKATPEIEQWVADNERQIPGWELDLENKGHLKDLLFSVLNLPVQRLTKTGKKFYGESMEEWDAAMRKSVAKRFCELTGVELEKKVREELLEYAATDKFTLNKMAVDHVSVRPLQEYRKVHKLYSTYVRPLRNITVTGIDKKARVKEPHLCFDSCIHASFLMTGTRGGRLSCIPVDQLVSTQRGLIPIGELTAGADFIQTPFGARKVTAHWFTGEKKVVVIKTKFGKSLRCSEDHRVYVHGKGYLEARRIKPGDSVTLASSVVPCAAEYQVLPTAPVKGRKAYKQPRLLNEEVGFVLGHFVAEGCIGKNKVRKSVNFGKGANQFCAYKSKREYKRTLDSARVVPTKVLLGLSPVEVQAGDLGDHLKRLYFKLFGIKPVYGKGRTPSLEVTSKPLCELFKALELDEKSPCKHVPKAILRSPRSVQLAFLRGYFEGDGGVGLKSASATTESQRLARDISLLLAHAGFFSSVRTTSRPVKGTPRYMVAVVHDFAGRSKELFWSKRKKQKVKPVYRRIHFTKSDYSTEACCAEVYSVELVGKAPMCDISVEDAECFLIDNIRVSNCRDPNLQQLPRDGEVKSLYVSRFGKRGCMYQGDLSQIELRLMASVCGDPTMIKAYFDETDLHTLTTSRIFSTPYDHFSKDHMKWLQEKGRDKEAKELSQKRNIGKTVNFLTGYGGGAFGLQNVLAAKSIYLKIEECEAIIASFFESYPALQRFLMHYKHFILEKHVAVSIFGRVRVFEEVQGDDKEAKAKALRAGCNHAIQSTASDMMLLALIAIENMMKEADLESILISTVHDSLLVDCIQSELPQVHAIVTTVLNNFPQVLTSMLGDDFDTSWLLVPFTGDCEVGHDYLSAKAIPKENIDWDKLLHPNRE